MSVLRFWSSRTVAPLAGCLALVIGSASPGLAGQMRLLGSVPSGKIKHVVVIVQENRSFNNLFQGYPGAFTVPSGKNSKGQIIQLQPEPLEDQYTIDHSFTAFQAAYDNGKMDGFDKEDSVWGPPNPEYVYVPQTESAPYFAMAHEFVLGDRMFTSHVDESFISHQYIIAGQASHAVNLPNGLWGCGGGRSDVISTLLPNRTYGPTESACFDNQTIGDELDRAGLTWHFYAPQVGDDGGEWSGYQAIKHIREGPDWANVISPNTQFFTDIQAGTLENVTWITPTCANSDHVNCGGKGGPSWVASLVNAVGESKFWNSTAIFVMWDDWGGLYDPVPPPYMDYDGLGIRVPLIVMSPYAKKNYVSHVQYEHGSVLRFIEDQFSLPQLAASDTRANSPEADCFNFARGPRPFVPIQAPYSKEYFLHQPPDRRPPDDD